MQCNSVFLLGCIYKLVGKAAVGKPPPKRTYDGIEIAAYKDNAMAAVTISADFELNWAWRGRLSPEETDAKGRSSRENVPKLLKIFDEHNIPITWATVGHLFLEQCERHPNGRAHSDMPRPKANPLWSGDWYMHDPCSDVKKDPYWYAPDLIQKILESKVKHEIGTHSFSHIICSPELATPELVSSEIQKCKELMKQFGLGLTSMVFPNNQSGFLDVLASQNIAATRIRHAKILLSYPECNEDGIYEIRETMSLGRPKYTDFLTKSKMLLREAMKKQLVYCLWFHPSDSPSMISNEFDRLLREIRELNRSGKVWIATMRELTSYCAARQSAKLRVKQKDNETEILPDIQYDVHRYGSTKLTYVIPLRSNQCSIRIRDCDELQILTAGRDYIVNSEKRCILSVSASAKSIQINY